MKLQFIFKHLDSSDALKAHTQEAMDHIEGYLLKSGTGHVTVSKEKGEFVIEIDVHSRQRPFHARSRHENVYTAVHEAVAKLEKQFLKVRKIYQNHKKSELTKPRRTEYLLKKAA